ncbi:MAG: RluA family pseudouridine synthase [Clostridia bacterium]|nr:RluA family pseudouridine synthase [Clostridia bacterium]
MKIYYQDDEIIVVEKEYGVSSQESNSENMISLIEKETGVRTFCVHRLDTQTTGVMVYAKTKESASHLSRIVASGEMHKEYLAVCHGKTPEYVEMVDLLYHDKLKNKSFVANKKRSGTKEAKLELWTQGEGKYKEKELSLVKILLHTGRTHQIRVQLSSRGNPLYGDGKYGAKDNDKIALHCYKLGFLHPNGKYMSFVSIPDGGAWGAFENLLPSE